MSNSRKADDLAPRPDAAVASPTTPMAPAIYPASVWSCPSTQIAESMMAGEVEGYIYQRDGHPNADQLRDKLCALHGAANGVVVASGMAAMAAALLSTTSSGERIVVSSRLYGKSLVLLQAEASRMGVHCETVDTCDLAAVETALDGGASLLVAETISNPNLRIANIPRLAEMAHQAGAPLLIDNTFATPIHCRPIELGADLVMESVSKMINGHSDVMLGALCGNDRCWDRVGDVVSAWGLNASPFDCFLAGRGLATLHLRMERAASNAEAAAQWLASQAPIRCVDYPRLDSHPDRPLADEILSGGGSVLAFHLHGGRAAADAFLSAVQARIPFAPSLGEVCTTLSHPATTSHRAVPPDVRESLGFDGGTLRLSAGVESTDYVIASLKEGLANLPVGGTV